jgi:MFS family permease
MEARSAARRRLAPTWVRDSVGPRRDAAGLFAATMLGFLATGATLPVLPRFVKGPVRSSDLAVGVVIGAFSLAAVLTRPVAGRLADRRGPRRVMVAGLLTMAASGPLLFVPGGVPALIVARLVLGIGEGLLFTAASTWIVDLAPAGRRGQVIGLFGLSVWAGLSLGTIVGEGLYGVAGYDIVWLFAGLSPLAGAVIARALRADHRPAPHELPAVGVLRDVAQPGLALALANAGYAAFIAFIVLDLGPRGGHGGAVITIYATTVVGARLLLGRLPDRLGARRCAIAAAAAEAAGLSVIALAGVWWVAAAGAVLMASGFSLLYPSLALVVIDRVAEQRRGSAMGIFTAFFDAGMGVGAPLAGALAALGGYGLAFWVSAAAAALAAAIVWRRVPALSAGAATHL